MSEVVTTFDGGDVIGMADIQEYQVVVMGAFAVHKDREAIRRGLWKQYEARDQAQQIKIKADRVVNTLEIMETRPDLDAEALTKATIAELQDIINYSVFGIRKLEGTA